MKKFFIIMLLLCVMLPVMGGMTYDGDYYLKNLRSAGAGGGGDPLYLFINEVDSLMTFGDGFLLLEPAAAPSPAAEGQIYYDAIANLLKFHNGTGWVNIEANTGGLPLDLTYDLGRVITVDNGTVQFTVPAAANNAALTIAQNDSTNNPKALVLTNAGSGVTIDIQGTSGNDIQGTGDTWGVTTAGVGTFVGLVTGTGDVTFTGATSNIIHDASANQLEFLDSSKLVFGTSDDISIAYDGSNNDLDILFDDLEISFGADGAGGDVIFHGETASTYMMWDEDADELLLALADLKISQGSQVEFIDVTDGATDWAIDNATDETLSFMPTEVTDDQTINFGDADHTTDFRLFGATASTVLFDASADQLTFDAYDVALGDSDTLEFGDSTDAILQWNGSLFKLDAVTTTAGTALQLETTDGGIHLNADGANNGDILIDAADVLTFTSADTKIFDGAAAETWIIEGTANEHEASIVFTDPTADVVFTFPAMAAQTVSMMTSTLATNGPEVANSVTGGTNQLIFEGTADAHETILTATDATADRTITLPNVTGTVKLASAAVALTPGAAVTLTVGQGNLYTDTITTDNEDQTITFSGAGYAGEEITILFATDAGAGDEVITFHATLVSSTGTLTLAGTGSRFYTITFISDGTHWYEKCRTAIQT